METELIEQITFTVDKYEIQSHSEKTLSDTELSEILSIVQNDLVLYDQIEQTIKDAIEHVINSNDTL